jgi:DNA-binding response OmpR family regulator
MQKILIIEDNSSISENISLYLTAKWYLTEIASDGERAFDMIRSSTYDLLIIDRMIPRIDGLSLVRMMQARWLVIPFLFLTALGKQVDRIEGLALGADDYLVKPFDLEELRLRIENILKRGKNWDPKTHAKKSSQIWNIILDTDAERVMRDDIQIDLSPKEYAILSLLWQHQGRVLSREQIYEELWGDYSDPFSSVLDTINVHIAHIRKKVSTDIIRTVKLSGYVIDQP